MDAHIIYKRGERAGGGEGSRITIIFKNMNVIVYLTLISLITSLINFMLIHSESLRSKLTTYIFLGIVLKEN